MGNFFCEDEFLEQTLATGNDLINNLTIEDVERFLYSLGVEQIENRKTYLICPTICHNALEDAASMKLYYYDDSHTFHCYTECSENFNIIELYRRYMSLNHYDINYWQAEDYIRGFLSHFETNYIKEQKIIRNENRKIVAIEQAAYNPNVMATFSYLYSPVWLREGISEDSMTKFDIRFSLGQHKIIIPHYDIGGNLIGIRGRALKEEDIALGKYRPITVGNVEYHHQLGFNSYGIFEHQDGIRKLKKAVIVEGEKSVLISDTWDGDYSNVVACCGSSISKFHINQLIQLGVNEITVAFDKEYSSLGTIEEKKYREKMKKICLKYCGLVRMSYVFDEHNFLEKKDSPFDKGELIWRKLYERRIEVH